MKKSFGIQIMLLSVFHKVLVSSFCILCGQQDFLSLEPIKFFLIINADRQVSLLLLGTRWLVCSNLLAR